MERNKTLVSIVIGLGIILIGGLAILGYGLFQRANNPEFKFFKSSAKTTPEVNKLPEKNSNLSTAESKKIHIPLNKGEWIQEMKTSKNKIIIRITNEAKNDRLLIIDPTNGSVIFSIYFGQPD
jgi:hypothetical protein